MTSPEVQAAIDQWQRGYTPTEWAQRHSRDSYRAGLQDNLARLILLLEGEGDELQILASVEKFAAHVKRLDEQLRRDLAGDRHPGRTDVPRSKGGAAA